LTIVVVPEFSTTLSRGGQSRRLVPRIVDVNQRCLNDEGANQQCKNYPTP